PGRPAWPGRRPAAAAGALCPRTPAGRCAACAGRRRRRRCRAGRCPRRGRSTPRPAGGLPASGRGWSWLQTDVEAAEAAVVVVAVVPLARRVAAGDDAARAAVAQAGGIDGVFAVP